jgi:hypothetical protein
MKRLVCLCLAVESTVLPVLHSRSHETHIERE